MTLEYKRVCIIFVSKENIVSFVEHAQETLYKKHVKLKRNTIYSIPKIHDTHCRDIISACMEMSSSLHGRIYE